MDFFIQLTLPLPCSCWYIVAFQFLLRPVDFYRFLTGEPDTVPEFCSNWTTVPRLTFQGAYTSNNPVPNPAQTVQQPPAPPAPPYITIIIFIKSTSLFTNAIHIGYTAPFGTETFHVWNSKSIRASKSVRASMSGTHLAPQPRPSTPGTQAPGGSARNLRHLQKVDYKELHTGKAQFLEREQFLKQCSSARISVRKSVAKVRKVTEMFLPISRNSSSSSTGSSKWSLPLMETVEVHPHGPMGLHWHQDSNDWKCFQINNPKTGSDLE